MGVEEHVLTQIKRIEVLDDGPNLHVRESKSLRQILHSLALDQILFENFTVEVHDRAVRLDGPSLHVYNILVRLEEWNFDIGMLPPFFGQDLDAKVFVFMRGVAIV